MNTNRVPVKSIKSGDAFAVTPQGTTYRAVHVHVGEPGEGVMVAYTIKGISARMWFAGKADVYAR